MDPDDFEAFPSPGMEQRWVRGILFGVLVGISLLACAAAKAFAHQAPTGWSFDGWCCNGDGHSGDCQQIPQSSVRPVKGGYQITLRPGDHGMVTRNHVFTKTQSEVRNAPDGQYYACLYPTEDTPRCFYAPAMGF